jgi:hypothetical protein
MNINDSLNINRLSDNDWFDQDDMGQESIEINNQLELIELIKYKVTPDYLKYVTQEAIDNEYGEDFYKRIIKEIIRGYHINSLKLLLSDSFVPDIFQTANRDDDGQNDLHLQTSVLNLLKFVKVVMVQLIEDKVITESITLDEFMNDIIIPGPVRNELDIDEPISDKYDELIEWVFKYSDIESFNMFKTRIFDEVINMEYSEL